MRVHNLQEELVFQKVEQLFDEDRDPKSSRSCHCEQCQIDVACYVLNRVATRYVVSERGFAHYADTQTPQESADLIALVTEGMERVSVTKRPHFGATDSEHPVEGLSYQFPVISGQLLNGANFVPMSDATVTLRSGGEVSAGFNESWRNPLDVASQARGRFGFWPRPERAASMERRTFEFELDVSARGFDEARHFFSLTLSPQLESTDSPTTSHSVGDIYSFPE